MTLSRFLSYTYSDIYYTVIYLKSLMWIGAVSDIALDGSISSYISQYKL